MQIVPSRERFYAIDPSVGVGYAIQSGAVDGMIARHLVSNEGLRRAIRVKPLLHGNVSCVVADDLEQAVAARFGQDGGAPMSKAVHEAFAFARRMGLEWMDLYVEETPGGEFRAVVNGEHVPTSPELEVNVEGFKGFFEFEFDQLQKGGADTHLRAAIGGLHDADEVWISDMIQPNAEGRSVNEGDFFVLAYTGEQGSYSGPKPKTTTMYLMKDGARQTLATWRWLKPVLKAGKIIGFEPVL